MITCDTIISFILGLFTSLIAWGYSLISSYQSLSIQLDKEFLLFCCHYNNGNNDDAAESLERLLDKYLERKQLFFVRRKKTKRIETEIVNYLVTYGQCGNLDIKIAELLNKKVPVFEEQSMTLNGQ